MYWGSNISNAIPAPQGNPQKNKEGCNVKKIMLRKVKDNQSGVISAIKVGGELGMRIRDMGLVPGATIKI